MDWATIIFYLLAAVAVLTAAGVVFARNPVHSAFALVISFLNVAGIYVLLGAEFLAAVQVIVYTGAILVLFLFVIMLVRPEDLRELNTAPRVQTALAWLLGLALFAELGLVIATGVLTGARGPYPPEEVAAAGGNTQLIGRILYSEFLLPFEVASLVLLVAVVAAVILGLPDRFLTGERARGLSLSLGHPTGADRVLEAERRGVPAVDAPDLGEPGTIDTGRAPVGAGRGR